MLLCYWQILCRGGDSLENRQFAKICSSPIFPAIQYVVWIVRMYVLKVCGGVGVC